MNSKSWFIPFIYTAICSLTYSLTGGTPGLQPIHKRFGEPPLDYAANVTPDQALADAAERLSTER